LLCRSGGIVGYRAVFKDNAEDVAESAPARIQKVCSRGTGRAVAIMVAAGMLAACGDDGSGARSGDPGGSTPSAQAPARPVVRAPEGFDTAKGWQATVSWLPEDAENLTVRAAREAGVVAFLRKRVRALRRQGSRCRQRRAPAGTATIATTPHFRPGGGERQMHAAT
jgi:hypothetical protein